jgi:hypothetical protein
MLTTFIKAGRDLEEPLEMGVAISLAVHKKPSTDVSWSLDAEDEAQRLGPWATDDEALAAVIHELYATRALEERLLSGELRSYVVDPLSGHCMRIGRHYWRHREHGGSYILHSVPEAPGWRAEMEGQPILVAAEDVPEWVVVADDFAAPANTEGSTYASAPVFRSRDETDRVKQLRPFLDDARKRGWLEYGEPNSYNGSQLYSAYIFYCSKRLTRSAGPLKRSRFHELLKAYREDRWS